MEGEHASLSGGICYSNLMAEQIIKKECHSVGCWQHLSLQPCVSIKAPGPSGGLFPLLFSISVFYLDLKWGLLRNSHLTASGAATFRSPFPRKVENAVACKRECCSPGRPCRSVQGGITIFRHAPCLGMRREGGDSRPAGIQRYLQKTPPSRLQGKPRLIEPSIIFVAKHILIVGLLWFLQSLKSLEIGH